MFSEVYHCPKCNSTDIEMYRTGVMFYEQNPGQWDPWEPREFEPDGIVNEARCNNCAWQGEYDDLVVENISQTEAQVCPGGNNGKG